MADIRTVFIDMEHGADYAIESMLLQEDGGLDTAVVISLFTDRRADPDDVIPGGSADKRGTWMDAYAVTAAGDVMQTAETPAITISGTPAAADMVIFQVYRDAANGSDTLAADARLHGIAIIYTTDAGNDA